MLWLLYFMPLSTIFLLYYSLKKFFHIFQVDIYQILFSVYLLVLVKVSFDLVLNISVILCRSVLFVEETGVPGENHRSAVSH
jgi:hypothetical protein